jgi:hypothetical protein
MDKVQHFFCDTIKYRKVGMKWNKENTQDHMCDLDVNVDWSHMK